MPPRAAASPLQGDCCGHGPGPGPGPGWRVGGGELHGEASCSYLPLRKRLSVDGKCPAPRICIWECDGEAGDITCDIVDALEASMPYKEAAAVAGGATYMRALPQRSTQRAASRVTRWASSAATTPECKRPGQTISKGHKNYELMLQLQLGIR